MNIIKKAINFAKALIRRGKDGFTDVSLEEYRERLQRTVGKNCSTASGYSSSALDENEVFIDDEGICFCGEEEDTGYELSSDLDFEKRKDLIRIDV